MDYVKENKQLKRGKSLKNIFLVFICEIVILILIVGIFIFGFSKYFDDSYVTSDEFKEILTNESFNVNDITEDYDNEMVTLYYFATKENNNLGVHYIVTDNEYTGSVVSSIFNSFNVSFDNTIREDTFYVNLFGLDYNYYSLENSSDYYVVVQNKNIIFSATGEKQYKDDINQMIQDLGFSYPGSITYLIIFTILFIFILTYIVLWKIFVKAGIKGWKALIPYYNLYCLSKITFNKGWYFIFLLIIPINILGYLILFYKLAKRFNKSTVFAILNIFFPYITMQIIAFDNSEYNKPQMTNNNSNITSDTTEIKEVIPENNIGKKVINAFKWLLTTILLLISAMDLIIYISDKLIVYLITAIIFLAFGLMACPTVSEYTKKYKTYTKFKPLIVLLLIMVMLVLISILPV